METEIIITESGQVLFPRGTDMSKEDMMELVEKLTNSSEDIGRVQHFLNLRLD
jgi:hypothetical protein